MKTNLSRYKDDLDRLIKLTDQMVTDLALKVTHKKTKRGESEPGLLFSRLTNNGIPKSAKSYIRYSQVGLANLKRSTNTMKSVRALVL